jgi:Carboxypeptidase regulatory-like domain
MNFCIQPGRSERVSSFVRAMRLFVLTAMCVAGMSVAALGQSTYGSIQGSVTDPTGAVVPAASVMVKETTTGETRTVTSDGHGDFQALNLNAGTYTVTITAQGFTTREVENVVVLARQSVSVDGKLQVSSAGQTVEVTAGAEVIDNDLTVSSTKSGAEINQLALNYRATNNTSPLVAANLAPTVQVDQSGNISIAGGLPNMTAFSLDGVSTQGVREGGPNVDLYPSTESIGEFKVNSGANNAEFGQVSDITVTSKGGTNQLHGAAFYFTQNAAFNAADPIQHEVLPVVANDFGVTLGGPVTIPHLYNGKGRTFFYFTYEGTRRPNTQPISEIVPSDSERAGTLDSPAFNPCTFMVTTDFTNCLNPTTQKALALLFPQPNNPNNPAEVSNLYTIKGNYHVDSYDGRIDQVLSKNQSMFVHYVHKDVNNTGDNGDSTYNPLLGAYSIGERERNLAGSYNWIIRPSVVNELRAGFSVADTNNTYPQALLGASYETQLNIAGLPPVPSTGGVEDFQVGDYVGGLTNSVGRPIPLTQHTYEVGDNVTWTKGRHNMKFGGEFTRLSSIDQISFTNGDEFGDYYYTGGTTGSALGDLLTDQLDAADYAQNGPNGRPYVYSYHFFGQDDWRMTPRLTLSYGLRYEINPPFNDATHQLGQFDRNFPGGRLIVQNEEMPLISASWRAQVGNTPFITASQAGLPDTLRHTYLGNIQPRFGFQYDPFGAGKTVVKAHVGAYSVPVLGATLFSLLGVDTSNFPEFVSTGLSDLSVNTVFGGGGEYPVNCNSASTLPAGAIAGPAACPGYRRANNENLKDPRVIQWNASVEQAFGANTVFRLEYIGSHTTQLIWSPDLNQLTPAVASANGGYQNVDSNATLRNSLLKYPNFQEVLTRDNSLSAKYNAMTAQVTRRLVNGLTYDGSFVWAKNLSNALGSAPSSLIGQGGQGDNGPNGLNYFDPQADYGNVIYTRRDRFVNTFLYQLPVGRGQHFMGSVSRPVDLLVGGWGLTGITVLQSGPFLTPTITSTTDPSGTDPTERSDGSYQRPDCVPGVNPNLRSTPGQFFNIAAFEVPQSLIGRFGNCPVGFLHGPGTKVLSLSIGKEFKIRESVSLRYEADFANILNIENIAAPLTQIQDQAKGAPGVQDVPVTMQSTFGAVTADQGSSGGANPDQAGPRTIQMSLRLKF